MAVAAEPERVAAVRRYRFTVDEFARMGEAGIFTEDDRVELLDGEIVAMTPIGALHAGVVSRLNELLVTRFLVIEVADSSLRYDRLEKVPRCGKAGIPETWLVDVEAGVVTVYTGPGLEGYARQQVRRRGDELVATSVPELGFTVDDVFGE